MKIERLKKKKWCKFICYLIIVAFILEIPMPAYASINLGDDAIIQSDDTTGSVDDEATNETDNGIIDIFSSDAEGFLGINTPEKTSDPQDALVSDSKREIVTELTDLREANVKYFLNEDGSQTASVYNHDVHYLDSNGKYEEIDNNLVEEKDQDGTEVFANKENAAKIKFAKNTSSNNLVSIKKDDFDLSWTLVDANKCNIMNTTAETNGDVTKNMKEEKDFVQNTISSTKYTNVFENVDLEYILIGSKIKENFIINDAKSPSQFSFVLKTKSLYVKESDSGILFCDEKGETVFNMSNMVMYDAKDEESCDIALKLETLKDEKNYREYQLTINPSEQWLKDSARAYPIILDPTITTTQTATTIYDTHVNSDYPNNNNVGSFWRIVGTMTGGKKSRTYLKFILPTQIQKSDRIVSATMYMHSNSENVNSIFYDYASSGPYMYLCEPTFDWSESTLTWNTQRNYKPNVVDYDKIEIKDGKAVSGWFDWDITPVVDGWYNGSPNYGVMIKDNETTQYSKRVYFHSTNDVDYSDRYPMIDISYMNMIGLEDYWTYHTQSAGLAGTGFVNDFTGGLTTSFEDYSWDSELLSLSVSHVYSSYNADEVQSSLNVGKGFMLSLQERMWRIVINGTELYRYTDGDGTQHYFQYSDSKWTDDSGLGLTMTMPGDGHLYVTDKQNNVRQFNSITGYLEKITDNDGNKITIDHTGGYFSHAYDDAGHMLTFNRDSNNRLTNISIKDRANPNIALKQIFYTYDSTGHLTQVQFPGKSTIDSNSSSGSDNIAQFGYTDSGTLNKLIDTVNGMHVEYTYDWVNQMRRVNGFQVYDASNQLESAYTMTYTSHCTRFNETTPNLGRNQVYVFNYMGQTISAQDQDGNALFCETGMSGGAKNKVTFSSKAQKTITNLLKNHDFEGTNALNDFPETGGSSNSIDTNNKFCGNNCLNVTTNSATSNLAGAYQTVTVKGGQSYTLSAYVKTSGCSANGAALKLEAFSGSTSLKTAETDKIVSENGYMRFETTIDLSSYNASNSYTLKAYFGLKNVSASAYFDSVQLETGKCSNRYNLIENGTFESASLSPWTTDSSTGIVLNTDPTYVRPGGGSKSLQITGNASQSRKEYQDIQINGETGDSFVFGCWVKSQGLPNKDTGTGTLQSLGMTLQFIGAAGTGEQVYKSVLITPTSDEWQYICASAVAPSNYTGVRIYLKYAYNCNKTWFDDVQVYKDSFGDSFIYDSKGNVISVVDKASNTASAAVSGYNDTTSYTDGKGQTYSFEYNNGVSGSTNHNLTKITSPDNTETKLTYDSFGNVIQANQCSRYTTNIRTIMNSFSYTSDGAYLISSTNQLGDETSYTYNEEFGLLMSKTMPVGVNSNDFFTINNSFDEDTRVLTEISSSFVDTTLKFGYTQNNLSSIQVGDVSTYQKYNYAYDNAGNMTSISHSSSGNPTSNILESYTYLDGRGLKASQSYANGQTLNYTYDNLDRLIGVTDSNGPISKYEYNSNGSLSKSYSYTENSQNPSYVLNQYDLAERLISTYNSKGSGIYDISYDKNNLATGYKSYLRDGSANLEYTTQYAYVEKDVNGNVANGVDKPLTDSLKSGSTTLLSTTYGYDAYGRLTTTLTSAGDNNVSHIKVGCAYMNVGTDKTTTMLDNIAIRYSTVPDSEDAPDIKYYPSYDRACNITEIETVLKDGSSSTVSYNYDLLSRLVSATNVADTGDDYTYSYDDRNNITGSTVTNDGTTESKTYTYATDDIDRLTSFSHTTTGGTVTRNYTYDAAGNPITISETDSSDDSTRNLTLGWTQGTLLSSISDDVSLNNAYYYDADGNVSKKTLADGSYVIYHYNDAMLEYEEYFNSSNELQKVLKYSYDANGMVEYLLYKDSDFSNANSYDLYYYVRNAVGDISYLFQIKEQSGSSNTVVNRIAAHYEYDPYGNILSVDKYNNDPIGDINPIRYKDYYYDLQTGWYQTASRFYDPEVGRFLNADDLSLLNESNSNVIDNNRYSYCEGNPIIRTDSSGNAVQYIIAGVLLASGGAYCEYTSQIEEYGYIKYGAFIPVSAIASATTLIPQASLVVGPIAAGVMSGYAAYGDGKDTPEIVCDAVFEAALTFAGSYGVKKIVGPVLKKMCPTAASYVSVHLDLVREKFTDFVRSSFEYFSSMDTPKSQSSYHGHISAAQTSKKYGSNSAKNNTGGRGPGQLHGKRPVR